MSNNRYYPSSQITLHWISAFLIALTYIAVYAGLTTIHIYCGLFVLAFSVWRVILGKLQRKNLPPINPPLTKPNKIVATVVKIALALLFIIIPVLGLFFRAYFGRGTDLFGIPVFPGFVPADEAEKMANIATAMNLKNIHETLGTIALGLIGLHAAGAIVHHYFMKDNTLVRMAPSLDKNK